MPTVLCCIIINQSILVHSPNLAQFQVSSSQISYPSHAQASLIVGIAKRTSRSGGLKNPFLGDSCFLFFKLNGFFLGGGGHAKGSGMRQPLCLGVLQPCSAASCASMNKNWWVGIQESRVEIQIKPSSLCLIRANITMAALIYWRTVGGFGFFHTPPGLSLIQACEGSNRRDRGRGVHASACVAISTDFLPWAGAGNPCDLNLDPSFSLHFS